MVESRFEQQSERAGSYFTGGFAQFGLAAGTAAAGGWKAGGHGGREAIAAGIGANRRAVWGRPDASEHRLGAVRIDAARGWAVEPGRGPRAACALRDGSP